MENWFDQIKGLGSVFELAPRVECEDGFSVSVQAHHGAYCTPRADHAAPYTEVELGFPSANPMKDVPDLQKHCEDPDRPTDTVYGYVPVELVSRLIAAHGGIKNTEPPVSP